MASARPLRDVFADLAGEHAPATNPAEVLAANGHPDLPDGLVAEAVVTYADTAPIEVAQHLSAFVRANSPVPLGPEVGDEPPSWLHALTTAPVVTDDPLDAGLDPHHVDPHHIDPAHAAGHLDLGHTDPGLDLDFGGGQAQDAPAHHPDPNAVHHDPYGQPLDGLDERHDLFVDHELDVPSPEHPLGHEEGVLDPHHPHDATGGDTGPAEDPGHHHH
jgi:hypothetical protein